LSLRVVGVAHDAGGGRALIPVLEELAQRGAATHACVAGPAESLWSSECASVKAEAIDDALSVGEARRKLREWRAGALLSAAGLYNQAEHTFRVAAALEGLRSVAVLDSWGLEAERFQRTTAGARVVRRPDIACALDERTQRALLAAGFAPEQVVVTGPPNLERSLEAVRAVRASERERVLAELGVAAGSLVIAFFSEPFATGPGGARFEGPGALVGADGRSLYGYTASEVLDAVLGELERAGRDCNRRCAVLVKPHPAEWREPLEDAAEKHRSAFLQVVVCAAGPAARVVGLASAAVGMMSIALLEAALADVPTVSVQPGLRESGAGDPCVASALGYADVICERAALREAMRRLVERGPGAFRGDASRRQPLAVKGAASRVARAVLGLPVERGRAGAGGE
jgi:hypothetical protein